MSELAGTLARIAGVLLQDDGGDTNRTGPDLPPGTGPTQKFVGPWFSTQLILSLAIGLSSFLLFCFLRTRWEVVYMGRTKLKDFSPAPAHSPDTQNGSGSRARLLGWIMPTLRTSEFTVLQTVGLDAAVLLNFFRMSFLLFAFSATLAAVALMPLNYFKHGSTDSEPDLPPDNSTSLLYPLVLPGTNGTTPAEPPYPTLSELILDPQTSATINLIFTYVITALTLSFLHRNFHRFVKSRQSFALHLIHSVSARTVLVTNLPIHLRGDRALADYFEGCGWTVESVSVCREVEQVKRALERRTNALLRLETAWTEWVGNPAGAAVRGYHPNMYTENRKKAAAAEAAASGQGQAGSQTERLIPDLDEVDEPDSAAPSREASTSLPASSSATTSRTQSNGDTNPWLLSTPATTTTTPTPKTGLAGMRDPETPQRYGKISTNRPRPTYRPRWFGNSVDAIEYWEKKFVAADEEVRRLRKTGKFEATHAAFVTFEDVKSAQMACQVVHYPHHSQVITQPAPEPRDVVWSQIAISEQSSRIRLVLVMAAMTVLLLFWIAPVSFLASLLSYNEIKKVAPWLAQIIESSPRIAAIVQNSLPILGIVTFNGGLPFLLSWLSYEQGYRSRSGAEYSLMRKYYLFLLISVLFIFLLTTTYWALVRDLADSPKKIPEKLATALQVPNARNFMVSYVMLQALGMMPLQLLNLGPLFTLGFYRGFFTKTPRGESLVKSNDYAEANAPPMLNYGWVYPQALLVFTITLVYSVVSPLILVFGALYFGAAYLVYKYKLLFIYFKPYESNGEAWIITFRRLLWALIIFQLFMTGLFSLGHYTSPYLPLAMVPLIAYTLWWSITTMRDFGPLSEYLALSSVCEVQRGEGADQAAGVNTEDHVTRSQSNLNHRRYAVNDETLYVAPSSKHTDYSQPPLNNFYYGVLNTGRRRYAHPALSGKLPFPWLPNVAKPRVFGDGAKERRGVVLSLRRKMGKKLRRDKRSGGASASGGEPDDANGTGPTDWMAGAGSENNRWTDSDPFLPPNSDAAASSSRPQPPLSSSQMSNSSNPWRDPTPPPSNADERRLRKQISFDPGSGIIALPDEEENVWDDGDSEGEEGDGNDPVSPSTYFHHPERRRTLSGSRGSSDGRGSIRL